MASSSSSSRSRILFGAMEVTWSVFEHLGLETGQMGTRTNGTRTNGSGLRLGQGNNCPGPICPRITWSAVR